MHGSCQKRIADLVDRCKVDSGRRVRMGRGGRRAVAAPVTATAET